MLDKLFKKKQKIEQEEFFSPLAGELISLDQVSDTVFSEKMMGDGVAIIPAEGVLVSPVEGEVIQVFHTKHAIGIRSLTGLEILFHVGLETVELNGEGFNILVEEGQIVNVGDSLLHFDIPFLKSKNKEIVTPIIITNSSQKVEEIVQVEKQKVSRCDRLFVCKLK
ncbi:PTS glucose transporter subunit IIA [Halalkalibacter sp. APA_J-10(15)]|uniref:PTS sugar transporter subunit IIA n=1 Tax=Halalkalibacter sp. APA_J-10(15) TaxID=2933805 RepID=UPI001FF2AD79|nr:PTS glucose transporter subunit IIA [Halalkalibacter sp. APA_J-10(15)]MCK0473377.1 PTS glucose transporter subunit IIA [Halalkalibacter sp. APA_J-10(15)]